MKIEFEENVSWVIVIVAVLFSLAYCAPQIAKVKHPEYEKCFVATTKDYPICHQKENK